MSRKYNSQQHTPRGDRVNHVKNHAVYKGLSWRNIKLFYPVVIMCSDAINYLIASETTKEKPKYFSITVKIIKYYLFFF